MEAENDSEEKLPCSVVVAPYMEVRPYTKPRMVGLLSPVEIIEPFRIAPTGDMLEAGCVSTVGGAAIVILTVLVAKFPAASCTTAKIECGPVVVEVASQTIEYMSGDDVEVISGPIFMIPSNLNRAPMTATSSVEEAERRTLWP